MEKEQSELSLKLQENKSDIDKLFETPEKQTKTKQNRPHWQCREWRVKWQNWRRSWKGWRSFPEETAWECMGSPHSKDLRLEDYDTCAQAVTDILKWCCHMMVDRQHFLSTPSWPKSWWESQSPWLSLWPLERQNDCPIKLTVQGQQVCEADPD